MQLRNRRGRACMNVQTTVRIRRGGLIASLGRPGRCRRCGSTAPQRLHPGIAQLGLGEAVHVRILPPLARATSLKAWGWALYTEKEYDTGPAKKFLSWKRNQRDHAKFMVSTDEYVACLFDMNHYQARAGTSVRCSYTRRAHPRA